MSDEPETPTNYPIVFGDFNKRHDSSLLKAIREHMTREDEALFSQQEAAPEEWDTAEKEPLAQFDGSRPPIILPDTPEIAQLTTGDTSQPIEDYVFPFASLPSHVSDDGRCHTFTVPDRPIALSGSEVVVVNPIPEKQAIGRVKHSSPRRASRRKHKQGRKHR
jgi:hypothetical protein